MYTVTDYLKYYKDIPLRKVQWNTVDHLVCSILTYLPVPSYQGMKTLAEFYQEAKKYEVVPKESFMVPMAYEVLELAKDAKRYETIKIHNFENHKTEQTQFGAATFRIGLETIIAFKGTDYSLIGWIENLRLAYEYPTYTHKLAIEYLDKNIHFFGDRKVSVVGHSKGGNLAMVAAMESTARNFARIKEVINFDGPGFRKDEYSRPEYRVLSEKLTTIIPAGSVVGVLLYNDNYTVIKSSSISLLEHLPTSWNLFGECFIPAELSSTGNRIHERTTKSMEHLDYNKIKEALESLFQTLALDYTSNILMSLDELLRILRNLKNIDPEVRRCIIEIVEALLTSSSEKKLAPRLAKVEPAKIRNFIKDKMQKE